MLRPDHGQWVARLMGSWIILAELSAGVMFTMSRFRPMAVWGGLLIWTPAIYFIAVAVLTGFHGSVRVVAVRLVGTVGAVILLGTAIAKLRAFV